MKNSINRIKKIASKTKQTEADNNQQEDVYSQLVGFLSSFKTISNKDALFDPFQTEEQKIRDGYITDLLKSYVDSFDVKVKETKTDRLWIKVLFTSLITVLVVSIIVISLYLVFHKVEKVTELIALITSLVTLTGSLFGTLKNVVERAFPLNDEEYITQIVKLIQENDLKHKQENIKIINNDEKKRHKSDC